MKRLALFAGLCAFTLSPLAYGQNIVPGTPAAGAAVSGTPTTGNCASWASATSLQDSGRTCGGSGAPGGASGDIQYNNAGAFGGSAATLTSGGLLTGLNYDFLSTTGACTAATNGIHLTAANTIGVCVNGSSVGTFTSTGLNGMVVGGTNPATGAFTALTVNQHIKQINGRELVNTTTAPTATSGFGTSPTVTSSSTLAFTVQVGSAGTPSATLVLGLSSTNVSNGWLCQVTDLTTGTVTGHQSGAVSTSSATFTMSAAPSLSDVMAFQCAAY